MRKLSLLLAACAVIAVPAPAAAQTKVPENDSALDQYVESLPGSGGDRPTQNGGGGAGGDGDGAALGGAIRSALEARGPVGAAVADLVETSGGASGQGAGGDRDSAAGGSAAGGSGGGGDEPAVPVSSSADEGSGVGNAVEALFGGVGGGMGIALPLILVGGIVVAALAILARRRGGEPAPPA